MISLASSPGSFAVLLTAVPRNRPHVVFRAIALVTATLLVSILVGALGAGGTYAFLSASAAGTPAATLTAGTATLSVSAGAQNFSNIAPGQTRTGLFTITNVGDVPLNLSISSIVGPSTANGLSATIGDSTCGGTQYSLGSFAPTPLATGASTTVCLTVMMALNAPNSAQWTSTAIAVQILGTQS